MEKKKNIRDDGHAYIPFSDSIMYCNPLINRIINNNEIDLDMETYDHTCLKIQYCRKYLSLKRNNNTVFVDIQPEEIEFQLANLRQVVFEVTDACNLKCKYCGYGEFYDDYDKRQNNFMNFSKAKLLLDYLIEKWNSPLNISHDSIIYISFYGGEPLLNMKFIQKVVAYMGKKILIHNQCHFSMTTNATLLNQYLPYLVKHRFHLLISLDGNKENHSYRTYNNGKNSFDQVYINIKNVQKKYPEYFEKYVQFNSVLHNKNSVSSIYNFIRDEFSKIPSITELNNTGIRADKQDDFFTTYQNLNESLYQSEDYSRIKKDMFLNLGEIRDIGLFLLKHSGNIFMTYNDFFIDDNQIEITPTGTCKPFGKKMFVTVNGKILPCERVGHQYALGTIDADGVKLNATNIASIYNNYFKKLKKQCNYCYNANACLQCIFQLDNLDKKPVCVGFMNETTFVNQMNYQMNYLASNSEMYERIINDMIIKD
jgi:uncharacterized protein